ncbi:MAG: hypothetical protein IJ515_02945 [Clostridia bacterium]|nr:hypothetical protein [Clostridia bacterium]
MRAIPKDMPTPAYWKTTLKEVEEALELVKGGTVTKVYDSAGGRPIYKVEYGTSNLPERTANLSSALGAKHPECYADKSGDDYIPTIFMVGCTHGGEFEGTCAMLNLIKLIETGTDYAGTRYDELVELAKKVHLILIPMVNPDGRSHIPFNTFVGKSFEDLRYFNQGTWKDGTLAGWPECKMKHPILPYVDYLGGYFNDEGVNMMHEDFIGGKISTGTQAVLDVCRNDAPDFSVLFHGGSNSTACMLDTDYGAKKAKIETFEIANLVKEKCDAAGVRYAVVPISNYEERDPQVSFNLPSAMHHCCGTPCVTFESNQGLCDHGTVIYDHDEIYASHMIYMTEVIRYYLKKFGKI